MRKLKVSLSCFHLCFLNDPVRFVIPPPFLESNQPQLTQEPRDVFQVCREICAFSYNVLHKAEQLF